MKIVSRGIGNTVVRSVPVWQRHLRRCAAGSECKGRRSRLPSIASAGMEVQSLWYCSPSCVEVAIETAFGRFEQNSGEEISSPRRLPLGLLLHARGAIDERSFFEALEHARSTRTRIGEVLLKKGMANERQITAAVAAQSGCPAYFGPIDHCIAQRIPGGLQRQFCAVPLQFVRSKNLLYVGFGNPPNYSFLVALEAILQCASQPAIVPDRYLTEAGHDTNKTYIEEICFSTKLSALEVARTCTDYGFRRNARRLRWAHCVDRFWVRLDFHPYSLDLFFPLAETRC